MYFRKTNAEDLLPVLAIYHHAIGFMQKNGNPHQWADEAKLQRNVTRDIQSGNSFIGIDDQGKIQVVFTLIGDEPTYHTIEGNWKEDSPYHTVHRLASLGNHAGCEALLYCLRNYLHLRIDTHQDNKPMQHLLSKLSFSYCGIITLEDRSLRLAYEKRFTLTDSLLDWYSHNRRDLPWRNSPDPYHVWISEIMLQQTRVESVKAYYQRFLERFPTIRNFAEAKEDVCLKLWQGLGYYSRVRNLHKAAVLIQENYGGTLPDTYSELISLPGIGDYTANAILSIAYQKKTVAVDGNLLRIYARLEALPLQVEELGVKKDCYDYFLPFLSVRPGDFNQALMDLGELVCLPHGTPLCDACPLRLFCKAHQQKQELDFPLPKKKTEKKTMEKTVFILRDGTSYLIRKRPDQGLLASLYEPFTIDQKLTLDRAEETLRKEGFSFSSLRYLGKAKHVFTHLIWEMQGYEVILDAESDRKDLIPATEKELETTYSIPTAFSYFLPSAGQRSPDRRRSRRES